MKNNRTEEPSEKTGESSTSERGDKEVGRRIRAVRGKRSRKEFAGLTGLGKASIERYENAERTPALREVEKIARALGGDASWYLTGHGAAPPELDGASLTFADATASLVSDTPETRRDARRVAAQAAIEGVVMIPLFAQRLSAGHGAEPEERVERLIPLADEDVARYGRSPEKLAAARVRGDSMLPTFADRDRVVFDRSVREPYDGLWVIVLNGEVMVKRLQVRGERCTILSDNERYPPRDVEPADDFHVIGQVLRSPWRGE